MAESPRRPVPRGYGDRPREIPAPIASWSENTKPLRHAPQGAFRDGRAVPRRSKAEPAPGRFSLMRRVGLLACGSSGFPHLPGQNSPVATPRRTWDSRYPSPLTVAGRQRIRTSFPVTRARSNSRGYSRNRRREATGETRVGHRSGTRWPNSPLVREAETSRDVGSSLQPSRATPTQFFSGHRYLKSRYWSRLGSVCRMQGNSASRITRTSPATSGVATRATEGSRVIVTQAGVSS